MKKHTGVFCSIFSHKDTRGKQTFVADVLWRCSFSQCSGLSSCSQKTSRLKRWVICQSHLSRKTIRAKKWHTAAFNWRRCTDTDQTKCVRANTTCAPAVYLNLRGRGVRIWNRLRNVKNIYLTFIFLFLLIQNMCLHFSPNWSQGEDNIVHFIETLRCLRWVVTTLIWGSWFMNKLQ